MAPPVALTVGAVLTATGIGLWIGSGVKKRRILDRWSDDSPELAGSGRFALAIAPTGDMNGDGDDEILTAPGPHPDNPAYLKTWNYDGDELSLVPGKSFLVFEEGGYVAGARIALGNLHQAPSCLP